MSVWIQKMTNLEPDGEEKKSLLPVVSEGAKKLPTDKFHISYSEFVDWYECSFRHNLKHIKKIDLDKPNEHTEYGGIMHEALENFLVSGNPLDVEGTAKKVREALENIPSFKKDDIETWASAVGQIFEEVPGFLSENFPNYKLVAAEYELMETLERKKDRFFKGFVDVILKYDYVDKRKKNPVVEERYMVADWKNTAWGWSGDKKRDPVKQMQLVLYKHFWAAKNNIPIDKVKCAWVLLKRDAKPGNHIELVPVSVGEKAIEKALENVYRMICSVEKQMFVKNRNSGKFCPYYNTEHCR